MYTKIDSYAQSGSNSTSFSQNAQHQPLVAATVEALVRIHDTLMSANGCLYELDGRLFGYEVGPPTGNGEKDAPQTEEAEVFAVLQRLVSVAVDVQVKAQKLNSRI